VISQNSPRKVSALLGVFFPRRLDFVLFILRKFRDYHIEGDWHGYYYIWVDGRPLLKQESWKISKGIKYKLKVHVKTLPDQKLSYKGYINIERYSLVVRLNTEEYQERIFCRFRSPIPDNASLVTGFWIGLDFNGRNAVGPHLLSRNLLTRVHKLDLKELTL
jgi:hypothetical protein